LAAACSGAFLQDEKMRIRAQKGIHEAGFFIALISLARGGSKFRR
jgi:hypothetical protein